MRLAVKLLVYSSFFWLLAGCSSLSPRTPGSRDGVATRPSSGGYYKDDGPGESPPTDLAAIPDAVPRDEPPHRFANRPYSAMGRNFTPIAPDAEYSAAGLASWYGRRFHGKQTSSGEPYDMYAMTAAHPTLPIPSYARVTNPRNGRSVIVRVNDRGPFHEDRLIDLSYTAAWKLDLLRGVERVEVTRVKAVDTPTSPSPGSGQQLARGIYLQVAALASATAADDLVAQMRGATPGLPGVYRVEADNLIKIQAGPFGASEEANSAAELIERSLGLKPFRVIR
jgi:rare lipoprotein A